MKYAKFCKISAKPCNTLQICATSLSNSATRGSFSTEALLVCRVRVQAISTSIPTWYMARVYIYIISTSFSPLRSPIAQIDTPHQTDVENFFRWIFRVILLKSLSNTVSRLVSLWTYSVCPKRQDIYNLRSIHIRLIHFHLASRHGHIA